ncbi:cytochrome P450 [Mycena olivaceomarginata]|nr:cytochrome P450 [Mycena olivaceomarginata]
MSVVRPRDRGVAYLRSIMHYSPDFSLVSLFVWAAVPMVSLVSLALYHRRVAFPRPPGPRGLPLVGNLFQLTDDSWNLFTKWKAEYGPIVNINLGGQEVIILNTFDSAAELLEKRSAIYSDRPTLFVAREILTDGLFFTFVGYGALWRRMRRAAQQTFRKDGVKDFRDIHEAEAATLAKALVENPVEWEAHLRRALSSTLMSVTYDTPMLKSEQDPAIAGILDFTKAVLKAAFIDGAMVENFPLLRYLPSWLAGWKKEAQIASVRYSGMYESLFGDVKKRVAEGDGRVSFAAALAAKQQTFGLSNKESAWLAAAFAAGSETVSTTLAWFLLAIIMNPKLQGKAHKELDTVVGRDRLPTVSDMNQMPYLRALGRETLRWHPVDPLGMQHKSTQDDWYNGYFIPKGTICIPNIWAINRDRDIYGSDADAFRPERFLDVNGELGPIELNTSKEDGHVSFGFGRRLCIGRHMAHEALFIHMATILWTFDIQPVIGPDGRPLIPTEDGINQGLVVRPQSFDCNFIPRFPEALSTLEAAVQTC